MIGLARDTNFVVFLFNILIDDVLALYFLIDDFTQVQSIHG